MKIDKVIIFLVTLLISAFDAAGSDSALFQKHPAGNPSAGLPDQALPKDAQGSWWARIQSDIRKEEYSITWQDKAPEDGGGIWQAPNRANGFRTYFTESGVRLVPRMDGSPSWEWGLSLVGWGQLSNVTHAPSPPDKNRIEYRHEGITEWFVNDDRGLEHGFTIPAPPQADHQSSTINHQVSIDLSISGTLHPVFPDDGQAVDFYAGGNIAVLRYSHLKVTDATGRLLPSHFEGVAGQHAQPTVCQSEFDTRHSTFDISTCGIRISIDDTDAVYPITVDPLVTTPSWTANGEVPGDYFGFSVSTAGDVNGDGYSDVIVGANAHGDNRGKAYLYLGGPSGLSLTAAWALAGDGAASGFGVSVSTAGDVNGDGYSDVIIGADDYNSSTGKAYLYLGGPSGLPATASWGALGESVNSLFGFSVSTAGDVNGDGYSDVIVGAYGYSSMTGKAYLYLGGPSGLSPAYCWAVAGGASFHTLGTSVATAGDVNADGYSDVIVGSPGFNKAFLYFGGPSGPTATASWTGTGEAAGSKFGQSVATAGDVNADGYADVMVGAPAYDSDTGKAYLYFGSSAGLSATSSWSAAGESTGNSFGSSVATAGDINGDGTSDVLIGAYMFGAEQGAAYLYLGGPSGLAGSCSWKIIGELFSEHLGRSAATAGDANGDGYSDVIVGAYGNSTDFSGDAYLYLGGPSGLSSSAFWTTFGESAGSRHGVSVSTAGDVNGDGYSDVIVGASLFNGSAGKAYLYLGGLLGPSSTASWTAVGEAANNLFGSIVSAAGDVNGDGYSDLIVGAYGNSSSTGKAYLYLGGPAGLSATASWTATGESSSCDFGYSIASAGDTNGDGYGDVIIGAWGFGTETGKAYLYMGGPTGLAISPSWTAVGESTTNRFGFAVGTAGDVNGDGYSDVVIGARAYSSETGKAYLYSGGPFGVAQAPSWTATGEAVGDRFGTAVGTAGDVNGDGYSDLLVGAYLFGTLTGKAYLYLGRPYGLQSSAAWSAVGETTYSYFGLPVMTAGDVNGDGYSDVVIGAQRYSSYTGRVYLYLGAPSGLPSSASWTTTGEVTSNYFGASLGTAGDVNGDGFSDVLVGGYGYSSSMGKAYLYLGGGGFCVPVQVKQLRSDLSAPISQGGLAYQQAFRLGLNLRSPVGLTTARFQYQLAPLGGTFNPVQNRIQTHSTWWISTNGGSARTIPISLPDQPVAYIWRVRMKYSSISSPFLPFSPWFKLGANGLRETDLFSTSAEPPDPPTCVLPDEPCWLYSVTKSGTDYTLNFQDPNQANQRTGWNIRRSNDPELPKLNWPVVGSNVVDMDAGAANYQWTDHSGDDPAPSLVWYYQVTTYNSNCPAEGPF